MTTVKKVLLQNRGGDTLIPYVNNASTQEAGLVKVDGETITIDNNGVISRSEGTVNVLSTSGTISLTDNSINRITPSAAVTFTLPTVSDTTKFHQILVQVNLSTVYTITVGTSYYFDNTSPDLSSTGVYNLIFEYDNANNYWVVGCVSKGAAS